MNPKSQCVAPKQNILPLQTQRVSAAPQVLHRRKPAAPVFRRSSARKSPRMNPPIPGNSPENPNPANAVRARNLPNTPAPDVSNNPSNSSIPPT